jgi:L-asparaginase
MCRFSSPLSLEDAIGAIAGPNGELQRSAAERWGHTGEGQGGIIGIEVIDEKETSGTDFVDVGQTMAGNNVDEKHAYLGGEVKKRKRGRAIFDFNCGGLFRAYYKVDDKEAEEPKVMVFKEDY